MPPDVLAEAECAAARVFRSIGTGAWDIFGDAMSARTLLYPIDYTMLDFRQWNAVAAAARGLGDVSAFIAPYGLLSDGLLGTYDRRLIALSDPVRICTEG